MIQRLNDPNEEMPRQFRPRQSAVNQTRFEGCVSIPFLVGFIVVIAFFILFGVGFIQKSIDQQTLLENEGVPTQARIVGLYTEDDSEGGTDYYIAYSYYARINGDRETFQNSQEINRKEYQSLQLNDLVPIIYAPSQPTISKLESSFTSQLGIKKWTFPAVFVGGTSIFILIPLLMFASTLRNMVNASKLNQEGVKTSATIIGRWVETDSENDDTYHLAFEFFPASSVSSGSVQLKQSVTKLAYQSIKNQSNAIVRYLPDRPHIARLELENPYL